MKKFKIKDKKKRKYVKRTAVASTFSTSKPILLGFIPSFLLLVALFITFFATFRPTHPEDIVKLFLPTAQSLLEEIISIQQVTTAFLHSVPVFLDMLNRQTLSALNNIFTTIYYAISALDPHPLISLLANGVSSIYQAILTILTSITTVIITTFQTLATVVISAATTIGHIFSTIISSLGVFLQMTIQTLGSIVTFLIKGITIIMTIILDMLSVLGQMIVNGAITIGNALIQIIHMIFDAITSFFHSLWRLIVWPFEWIAAKLKLFQPVWDVIGRGLASGVEVLHKGSNNLQHISSR